MLNENFSLDVVNAQEPLRTLADYSPQDKPWDIHRAQTDLLAGVYAQSNEFEIYAGRMRHCSGVLHFGWNTDGDTGESRLKLRKAQFCRVRHCSTCAWRRTLMWKARFYKALPEIVEAYPSARWLFLTLTVRNCYIHNLGSQLDAMNKAWGRLVKRKEFASVQGWIRSTEVTRGKDGSAHPHFHAIIMVSPSYFTRNYVKKERWSALWGECLKVDYLPVVDIKVVRPKHKQVVEEMDAASMLRGAVAETLKYSVKPSDLIKDDGWMLEYTRQVHRKRFIASGGALKDVLKENEESNDDLIVVDGDDQAEPGQHLLAFGWERRARHYVRAPHRDACAE